MPEWKEDDSGFCVDIGGIRVDAVKLGGRPWGVYLSWFPVGIIDLGHHEGTKCSARQFSLEAAERWLKERLAQVRAMKEGTDDTQ